MLPLDHGAAIERMIGGRVHLRVTTRIVPDPLPAIVSDHFADTEVEAIQAHLDALKQDLHDGQRRETTWVYINAKGEEIRGVPI